MGWIKRHRGKLFFFSLILSIFYSLPLAMLIGLVIFLIVRAENKKALARGAKEGNIEGDWFERHKGLSASLILLFVITLPFTLFPILFLFAMLNSMLPELHDFTQTEANEIVLEILEKENIPIVKNIGIVRLPALTVTPVSDEGPSILNFDNVEECGKVCQKLIDSGYVDIFIESYQSYKSRADNKEYDQYREYSDKLVANYLGVSYGEYKNTKWVHHGCKSYNVKKNYKVYLCSNSNNFYFALLYAEDVSFNPLEKKYGNPLIGEKITIEGRVTWYELYNYLEEQKND